MTREALLEKYLHDRLTETDRQEFNELLKNDPEFKEEVAFETDIKRAVTAEEDANFMDILSDFESEAREEVGSLDTNGSDAESVEEGTSFKSDLREASDSLETDSDLVDTTSFKSEKRWEKGTKGLHDLTSRRRTFPTKWLVAASVALLIGLTYFTMNRSSSPEELYQDNFAPYRNVTYPITRGEEAVDEKTQAFLAYSKGDYEAAVPLFETLYTSEQEPYYLFYQANALIELNRAGEAIPLLEEHLKTSDPLTDKSSWYLAMAYLQLEEVENAKKVLKDVVDKNAYKAEDAKRLLEEL